MVPGRKKTEMPTPRNDFTTAVIGSKIYTFGGRIAPFDGLQTLEVYDATTDTWEKRFDMPTGRRKPAAVVVDGKIYVIGGEWDTESAVFEYEPIADTWSRKSDMPTGRDSFGASTLNGRLYAIGGVKAPFVGTIATVERYDPATDTWEKLEDMPTARAGLSTAVVNRRVYAIGGATGLPYGNPGDMLGTVEEYTPEGWKPTAVSPRGKLTTTWGEIKRNR